MDDVLRIQELNRGQNTKIGMPLRIVVNVAMTIDPENGGVVS
jgi:hypothetical protein